jgi:hypothetical protein
MKAELFVHAGSQDIVPVVRRLVAECIDADLPLEVNSIDTGRIADNLKIGTRYSQLLQAAIPPELGLSLGVSWLSWLGERIYLQVYWPVITVAASGYTYDPMVVPFFPNTFDSFFPALAIRDRMVMVPRGEGRALGTVYGVMRISSALKDDILQVNYKDEDAIRAALRTVSASLSQQLAHELTSWAAFQPPGPLNLQAAASDLEVSVNLFRRVLADRVEEITAPYKRLSGRLDKVSLPFGRWTRVTLTVTNASSVPLTGMTVSVSGPVEVLPSRVEVDVPAGSAEIQLSIKPVDEGEFPIEITFVQASDAPFSDWLPPVNLWLESVRDPG